MFHILTLKRFQSFWSHANQITSYYRIYQVKIQTLTQPKCKYCMSSGWSVGRHFIINTHLYANHVCMFHHSISYTQIRRRNALDVPCCDTLRVAPILAPSYAFGITALGQCTARRRQWSSLESKITHRTTQTQTNLTSYHNNCMWECASSWHSARCLVLYWIVVVLF